MVPPDCAKQKLDGVVDSVPPVKAFEVLDGELAHDGMKMTVKILLIVMIPIYC